jgi:2-dehydro-3-deoxyphosphogluconate aldolase/(4S)-4-hydroxy-2-oxoglutarate aldolase
MSQNNIREILAQNPVIPVVKIASLEEVIPLVNRLQENGVNCIEITLRTDCALEAIKLAKQHCKSTFKIGVGTVVTVSQLHDVVEAGVDFVVCPGLHKGLVNALAEIDIPFLPGVMTPSEIMEATNQGWDTLKLFPANLAGGLKALKTYSQVFPQVKFCPTGGLTKENYSEYLSLGNVISVGGSWIQNELKT